METSSTLIGEIATLVYRINQETPYCAWLVLAGHVNSLRVTVASDKADYLNTIEEFEFYLDENPDYVLYTNPIEQLTRLKKHLHQGLEVQNFHFHTLQPAN